VCVKLFLHFTLYVDNIINNICILISFVDWLQSKAQSKKLINDTAKSKFEKDNVEYGKFIGNYKNDGVSGEFDSLTYSHSEEMLKVYKIFLLIFFYNFCLC